MKNKLQIARQRIPPCDPPFWARGGHLQTLLGHLIPSSPVRGEHKEFLIPLENENEKIHSTYLKGSTLVVVYIFHGLGGSADAGYMQRTARVAQKLGHHVFINNHRGCGKGEGLARGTYHSGRAEDLSAVIKFGREMFPSHRHIAIGFSLSANALLLLGAKVRGVTTPDAGIAVNGPLSLTRTSLKLSEGANKIYDKSFVLELQKYIKKNRKEDFSLVKDIKTLREFDEVFTAPIGGFDNREHYYESCSSIYHLKNIKIPMVLLSAYDDPFIPFGDYLNHEENEFLHIHLEKYGGHMGYLTKRGWINFDRWQDLAIGEYLVALTTSGN